MEDHSDLVTDGWFTAYPVTRDIWRISDQGNDNLYLMTGNKAAMLIDTGYGKSGLTDFISKLTSKPLIITNTHGHFDHALGNDQFDTIYIGQGDIDQLSYEEHDTMKEYVINSGSLVDDPQSLPFTNMWGVPARTENITITDGMEFDLGGEILTAYLTPGHSKGSVCFFAEKSGVLFAGDSYVPLEYWGPMWFHNVNCASLEVFHQSMMRLTSLKGIKFMLSGHGECGLLPISRLNTLLDGIERVITGKDKGVREQTLIGTGMRIDWTDVGVVYDPQNIH